MRDTHVLMQRVDELDCHEVLARFVDVLMDVEPQLREANEWQWDSIVRDACRQEKNDACRQEKNHEELELIQV